jgi:hypothetical protein
MLNPCSTADFPTPFAPVNLPFGAQPTSRNECLALNSADADLDPRFQEYFWGVLDRNRTYAIDRLGRGPYLVETDDYFPNSTCYVNSFRYGSTVYQRLRDFHGRLYEMQRGKKHQGYGNSSYLGYFNFGSLYIDLPMFPLFSPERNCTPGYFWYNHTLGRDVWLPGTCEADIVCNQDLTKSEATACSEGFVCSEGTDAVNAEKRPCPPGYACDFGTTPDVSLFAPNGMYQFTCPAGSQCRAGTFFSQRAQVDCAAVRARFAVAARDCPLACGSR